MRIDRIPGVSTIVGESPVWDASIGALWFIDIVAGTVHRLGAGDAVDTWEAPASPGAVAPIGDGRAVVALEEGFTVLDPADGGFAPVVPIDPGAGARVSEGKIDRLGRLVVMTSDRAFRSPIGRILRREHDGSVTVLREGIALGNSLCWSLDGRTMYYADSLIGTLYAADYDPDGGLSGERVVFTSDDPSIFPDGATVDAEDHLWVVLHGSAQIARFAPDGRIVDRVDLPSPMITSLTFAGDDADILYATSADPARVPGLPEERAHDWGDIERGILYRVVGLGVRGVPEPLAVLGAGASQAAGGPAGP